MLAGRGKTLWWDAVGCRRKLGVDTKQRVVTRGRADLRRLRSLYFRALGLAPANGDEVSLHNTSLSSFQPDTRRDMVVPRLQTGVSDPVSYSCRCPAKEQGGGTVLLFYRYFANDPPLPADFQPNKQRIEELAAWHREVTARFKITGKIRIACEGFNITVGGTTSAIKSYIEACKAHWSFAGLALSTPAEEKAFFKPSLGCACVFLPASEAAIRVCAEITPLGITNYAPSSWSTVEELPPPEFHRRCHEDNIRLLDLRNHYESRIGYFVSPQTGDAAFRPQIRRFSQWPRYVKAHEGETAGADQVLTYCTGGIRCEKATRWMAERENSEVNIAEPRRICTLKGGIAAYLDWVDDEIAAGRMTAKDSLFKGKNYVFDARGAMGLSAEVDEKPVSKCHVCEKQEDRLSKCRSPSCHLVLVVCAGCEDMDPRCCQSCRDQAATEAGQGNTKDLCDCEKAREFGLWGSEQVKPQKSQGWRKAKTKDPNLNFRVKIID